MLESEKLEFSYLSGREVIHIFRNTRLEMMEQNLCKVMISKHTKLNYVDAFCDYYMECLNTCNLSFDVIKLLKNQKYNIKVVSYGKYLDFDLKNVFLTSKY